MGRSLFRRYGQRSTLQRCFVQGYRHQEAASRGGGERIPYAARQPVLLQLDSRSRRLQSRREAGFGLRRLHFSTVPDFTTSREMYATRTFNPSTEYSTWIQHAYDFTGDGWTDVVATGQGAVLYVNPGNESRRWKQYVVLPSMQSEDSLLADVDGDGKPELIYIADGYMRLCQARSRQSNCIYVDRSYDL